MTVFNRDREQFDEGWFEDQYSYSTRSFQASGVAFDVALKVPIYRGQWYQTNFYTNVKHFTTMTHSEGGDKDSMTTSPTAGFTFGLLL